VGYPASVTLGYFEVAAEVIPLLFFVLLFDMGLAISQQNQTPARDFGAMLVVVILGLAAGEILALAVVAGGRPSRPAGFAVTLVIASVLGTIAWGLIETSMSQAEASGSWLGRHHRVISLAIQSAIVLGAMISYLVATY
jgi:hypothetical protein